MYTRITHVAELRVKSPSGLPAAEEAFYPVVFL